MNMLIFTVHEDYKDKLDKVFSALEKITKNNDQFFLDEECVLRPDYAVYVKGTDKALAHFRNKFNQKYYDAVFEISENMSSEAKGDIFDNLNFDETLEFNNYQNGLMPL